MTCGVEQWTWSQKQELIASGKLKLFLLFRIHEKLLLVIISFRLVFVDYANVWVFDDPFKCNRIFGKIFNNSNRRQRSSGFIDSHQSTMRVRSTRNKINANIYIYSCRNFSILGLVRAFARRTKYNSCFPTSTRENNVSVLASATIRWECTHVISIGNNLNW